MKPHLNPYKDIFGYFSGLALLSDLVSRWIQRDSWIIGLGIVTSLLSIGGLIISFFRLNAHHTTNRARLVALFCCIISSTVAWAVGVSFIPSLQIYFKPKELHLVSSILSAWITWTCEGIRLSCSIRTICKIFCIKSCSLPTILLSHLGDRVIDLPSIS